VLEERWQATLQATLAHFGMTDISELQRTALGFMNDRRTRTLGVQQVIEIIGRVIAIRQQQVAKPRYYGFLIHSVPRHQLSDADRKFDRELYRAIRGRRDLDQWQAEYELLHSDNDSSTASVPSKRQHMASCGASSDG
jgi:hypothetical protein